MNGLTVKDERSKRRPGYHFGHGVLRAEGVLGGLDGVVDGEVDVAGVLAGELRLLHRAPHLVCKAQRRSYHDPHRGDRPVNPTPPTPRLAHTSRLTQRRQARQPYPTHTSSGCTAQRRSHHDPHRGDRPFNPTPPTPRLSAQPNGAHIMTHTEETGPSTLPHPHLVCLHSPAALTSQRRSL